MATLTLTKVWVNRLDTGQAVSAQSVPNRPRVNSMDGDVRTYAGGRRRAIGQEGVRGQFTFTLRLLDLATVKVLESWMLIPVLVRDHKGQEFRGVYFTAPAMEYRDQNVWDVTIPLQVITADEGV